MSLHRAMTAMTANLLLETITPTRASELLQNNANNRAIRKSVVERYAEDMLKGIWDTSWVNPIILSQSGRLLQGQHRLFAIIKSGVTLDLFVQREVSEDSYLNMDSGTPRNLADYERFSGTNVNSRHISAAVMMRRSLTGEGRKRTNQANHDYVLKHFDALDFAVKALPSKRGIASAPVIAVFARAWYTQDRAKLNEAAEVLNTGVSTHPLHGVLIRHRDYCIGEGSRRISAGFGRQDLYARTERALVAFLEGQQLVKIYPVSKECFLLPEEMNE